MKVGILRRERKSGKEPIESEKGSPMLNLLDDISLSGARYLERWDQISPGYAFKNIWRVPCASSSLSFSFSLPRCNIEPKNRRIERKKPKKIKLTKS
eukprot:TRINITY_DN12081_c0_g1_i1.p2 TRINITY_DN12081_c0_g1~~TRINITY_DN12081_c0_g1_i1.p2  ORF type:complete len:111 (-),score=21.70 TRINITY_DN12081_c0_g1_i1:58-348(-)